MCVVCLCAEDDNVYHPKAKTFCLASFLAKKRKDACEVASVFFYRKKAPHSLTFCLRMMKNCQHQHKGKPHTQEKSEGSAISVEDAIIIIRDLNLFGAHCNLKCIGNRNPTTVEIQNSSFFLLYLF